MSEIPISYKDAANLFREADRDERKTAVAEAKYAQNERREADSQFKAMNRLRAESRAELSRSRIEKPLSKELAAARIKRPWVPFLYVVNGVLNGNDVNIRCADKADALKTAAKLLKTSASVSITHYAG